ncbi:DUF4446 family protein [Zhaonella formicivorans]|jgi:hypothetical protein|uniref:DUF4446 family protein n=1 Tax=Zhaonella formicivorans TaxID=2528593 RepID=UPI0010F15C51|nr:DUF4446 family protein [Zhaonella formicivorans]
MSFNLSGLDMLNSIIANNLALVISILLFFNIVLFVALYASARGSRKLWQKYREMMAGCETQNLEQMLIDCRKRTEGFAEKVFRVEQAERDLENKFGSAVQKVAVIRYNAFPEMGSDLSFSVALLDANANGVVLTSIYGREESRTFAKPVEAGTSSYRLTEEEIQAIQKAMEGGKQRK